MLGGGDNTSGDRNDKIGAWETAGSGSGLIIWVSWNNLLIKGIWWQKDIRCYPNLPTKQCSCLILNNHHEYMTLQDNLITLCLAWRSGQFFPLYGWMRDAVNLFTCQSHRHSCSVLDCDHNIFSILVHLYQSHIKAGSINCLTETPLDNFQFQKIFGPLNTFVHPGAYKPILFTYHWTSGSQRPQVCVKCWLPDSEWDSYLKQWTETLRVLVGGLTP